MTGEVIPMRQDYLVIDGTDNVLVVSIADIRRLANGTLSIAEFSDPELAAKCLAVALLERL